jgi:hypothetical protein
VFVMAAAGRAEVTLDIVADDDDAHGVLTALDADGAELARMRVPAASGSMLAPRAPMPMSVGAPMREISVFTRAIGALSTPVLWHHEHTVTSLQIHVCIDRTSTV